MKKKLVCLFCLVISVFAYGQSLQFSSYHYADLCCIYVDRDGRAYISPVGSSDEKEISVTIDQYGFMKLFNEDHDLYIIDGGRDFIDSRIKCDEAVVFPDGSRGILDCKVNGDGIKHIRASSSLTDRYHEYSPEGALCAWYVGDSDIWGFVKDNIPWVEGKKGYGIGEYIEFETDEAVLRPEASKGLTLQILNGYVNPEKPWLYKENSRIRKATLYVDGKRKEDIFFNDYVEIKNVRITGEVHRIRLVIDEVYEGSKYEDTCITGLSVVRNLD